MARPVVGIYASVAPATWGPWVDRPSVLAPVELGEAVQRAGAMAVLLAPGPVDEQLLRMLDALVVSRDAEDLAALLAAARELDLTAIVVDGDAATADVERELAARL